MTFTHRWFLAMVALVASGAASAQQPLTLLDQIKANQAKESTAKPAAVAPDKTPPGDVAALVGRDREGALELRGPVVVVETVLPSDTFVADDTEYRVYDGMQGTLEAEVRSETLLETLVPALKQL